LDNVWFAMAGPLSAGHHPSKVLIYGLHRGRSNRID
jgi:hypothetical protein